MLYWGIPPSPPNFEVFFLGGWGELDIARPEYNETYIWYKKAKILYLYSQLFRDK